MPTLRSASQQFASCSVLIILERGRAAEREARRRVPRRGVEVLAALGRRQGVEVRVAPEQEVQLRGDGAAQGCVVRLVAVLELLLGGAAPGAGSGAGEDTAGAAGEARREKIAGDRRGGGGRGCGC